MNNSYKGFLMALGAYLIWGLAPLFYKLLNQVSPTQIVLHRLVWCFFFSVIFSFILFGRNFIKKLNNIKSFSIFVLSGILICSHWFLFNHAVSNNLVIEASLGYFLTPLISCFLGWLFLKEKPDYFRQIAILLGLIAVFWLVLKLNKIPWLSLLIALSFGFYGFVKKKTTTDSLTALVIESGFLLPFFLIYWIWLGYHHQSAMNFHDMKTFILLIIAGFLTASPLFLYASAFKHLSLTAVGFMLYLTPTIQFLCAVFILKEPLDVSKFIGFAITWVALIVFSIGALQKKKHPNS
ncbi:MAG: EamA family transporter RarD [Sediminibacterium sp.]|nr:EamA family transporter RarD [Sediminibacterium sp.]